MKEGITLPLYLYGLLLLLSLVWGASFFFIKVVLEGFGPLGVAFLRCLFGVIVLMSILLVKREAIQWRELPWVPLLIVAFLNSSIPWSLLAYSETKITSSLAAVLNASTPIWTLLIGMLIFKLRSSVYQCLGITLGFLGIMILIDISWGSLYVQDSLAVGAMILVTLSYGYSSQLSKRTLEHVSVYQIAFITLAVGSISSGIAAGLFETNSWSNVFEVKIFWSLIGLGTFGSGIAYIIYFHLIQKGSAEFATMVTYLVPPFAILWGFFLLQEPVTSSLLVGLVLILSGVGLSTRKKKAALAIEPGVKEKQA